MASPHRRVRGLIAIPGAFLLIASLTGSAAGAGGITVVADGLDNPRGIDVGSNGRVLVAETGAGRVWSIVRGQASVLVDGLPVAVLPEGEPSGVVGVSQTGNGATFATIGEGPHGTTGFSQLVRLLPSSPRNVADLGAYQATDPDPWDQDEPANPFQSNPYGVASLGDGRALVTDAGNNDLVLISGSGKATTVARFPTRPVSTGHVPFPMPPALPAEAVPTTVAVGPDGAWYVGQLLGFPFTPGESTIWRIEPWARNAICDADTSDGCSAWMAGFTAIVGIDFGPDGSLYVAEFAKHGLLACFVGGDCGGALWHVKHGVRHELAAGMLVTPGDVAVGGNGAVWVTNFSIQPGMGQVLRIAP